jgi:serine O-acetyltransferase
MAFAQAVFLPHNNVPAMFTRLREDITTIRERDPAARSAWEVLTCYPGLHALVLHRFAHACWQARRRWLARQWGGACSSITEWAS